MTLTDLLSEIKARAEKATPEWRCRENGEGTIWREFEIVTKQGGVLFRSTSYGNMKADAHFIAHARTDVPRLVAALDRAMKQRNTAMGMFGHLASQEQFDAEIESILKGEA